MQDLWQLLTNSELLDVSSHILAKHSKGLSEKDVEQLCAITQEFRRRDKELFTLKKFAGSSANLNA